MANALLAFWQPMIEDMASATASLPNKGVGHLIRKGVKARGIAGRESVILERLVWARRREMLAVRKAARQAALSVIEAGLSS